MHRDAPKHGRRVDGERHRVVRASDAEQDHAVGAVACDDVRCVGRGRDRSEAAQLGRTVDGKVGLVGQMLPFALSVEGPDILTLGLASGDAALSSRLGDRLGHRFHDRLVEHARDNVVLV